MLARASGIARSYAATESLYCYGPPGSGKSHLAAALLNALAESGIEGRYGSTPALLRLVRQGMRDGTADDRLEALQTVPLLVLDDLGTESPSDWSDTLLFDLLNAREVAGRATVITSNAPPEALRDARVRSRILGGYTVLPLIASDYRLLPADRRSA